MRHWEDRVVTTELGKMADGTGLVEEMRSSVWGELCVRRCPVVQWDAESGIQGKDFGLQT